MIRTALAIAIGTMVLYAPTAYAGDKSRGPRSIDHKINERACRSARKMGHQASQDLQRLTLHPELNCGGDPEFSPGRRCIICSNRAQAA